MSKIIWLLLDVRYSYGRGILQGLAKYARSQVGWEFRVAETDWRKSLPEEDDFAEADGIVLRVLSSDAEKRVGAMKLPAVNISSKLTQCSLPTVKINDEIVGRQAAEHFLELGFQQFAFVGPDVEGPHVYVREQGFREQLGSRAESYSANHHNTVKSKAVLRWLREQPKPLALFAYNDRVGRQVIDLCRKHSISVPEQVAVVGVDDDEVICELASPPMSSVRLGTERVGLQAGELLAGLMRGQDVDPGPHLVAPLGVVPRASSNTLAVEDEQIARAVRLIRAQAHKPITVEDIVEELNLSRRMFELRFRRAMGCTPHDEIRRAHIQRAKQLLAETDLPIGQVATKSGFSEPKHLSTVFRQVAGITPTAYRRSLQIASV